MSNGLTLPSAGLGVVVNTGDTAERAAQFLGSTGAIFRKGGKILRLDGDHLEVVPAPMMQTLLFSLMNVQVWTGRGQNAALMPATEIKDATLQAIISGHHVTRHIPQITVVAQRSYMVLSDGRLVSLKKGYNQERGGVLVLGGEAVPDVPTEEAVQAIEALLADFKFATPSDRSRGIAAILCAAMRIAGIYERHPMLVFEADNSQAGKTLLWAMICAIFGQRYGTVAQKRGGTGSLDESLMDKLVKGYGFILLDNIRGRIDSPFLEACLTPEGGRLDARVPGMREIPVDPNPVQFGMTSNAAEVTTDLANRSQIIRIRKQPGYYPFRVWTDAAGNEVGIREHITSRQAYYQGCVNAIITDWWSNGAKRLPCTEHSFRETMGALDYMVQTYFKAPPLLEGHLIALERTTKPGLSWLRQIALTARDRWHVDEWSASKLAERCEQDGIAIPGVTSNSEPKAAAQQIGIAMGSAFGSLNSLIIDDVLVTRTMEKDSKGHENKFYSFKRAPA